MICPIVGNTAVALTSIPPDPRLLLVFASPHAGGNGGLDKLPLVRHHHPPLITERTLMSLEFKKERERAKRRQELRKRSAVQKIQSKNSKILRVQMKISMKSEVRKERAEYPSPTPSDIHLASPARMHARTDIPVNNQHPHNSFPTIKIYARSSSTQHQIQIQVPKA